MADKKMNIPMEYLRRAAADPDFTDALALTLMVKANFGSSVFMNYTKRKLQSFMHINFQHMSKAVSNAVKFGLVRISSFTTLDGKERTDLVANKMPKDCGFVRIHTCESDFGIQMYLESKTQDNHEKYSKATKHQSLKDVRDLLLLASLTLGLERHDKKYDAEKWQGMERLKKKAGSASVQKAVEEMADKREMGVESLLNTGFSYDKMGEIFEGTLTRYKITALVKMGVENGLFTVKRNDIAVKYDNAMWRPVEIKPKGNDIRSLFEASMDAYARLVKSEYLEATIAYDRLNRIAPLMKRCYRGVIFENGAQVEVWLMRMGNSYHTTCDILGWTARRSNGGEKSKSYNRDHIR